MKKLILYILFALVVGACGGGGGGSGQPSSLQNVPFSNCQGVSGDGNLVVASYTDTTNNTGTAGFKETLRIFQQDATGKNLLLDLASVYTGVDTLYHGVTDISLTPEWLSTTIRFNETDLSWISLVSRKSHPAYSLSTFLELSPRVERALASSSWLLVAGTNSVALFDIRNPTMPVKTREFSVSSNVTSLASISDNFIVFTSAGYGFLDTSNFAAPSLTEFNDLDIKDTREVHAIGSTIHISGPSKFAGKSKIARVNFSNPIEPIMETKNDEIDGAFVDFAYDGTDTYVLSKLDGSFESFKSSQTTISSRGSISTPAFVYNRGIRTLTVSHGRFYVCDSSGLNEFAVP